MSPKGDWTFFNYRKTISEKKVWPTIAQQVVTEHLDLSEVIGNLLVYKWIALEVVVVMHNTSADRIMRATLVWLQSSRNELWNLHEDDAVGCRKNPASVENRTTTHVESPRRSKRH